MSDTELNVTITKKLTGAGSADHIQILSSDHISVNVVFMAKKINVVDHRPKEKENGRKKNHNGD